MNRGVKRLFGVFCLLVFLVSVHFLSLYYAGERMAAAELEEIKEEVFLPEERKEMVPDGGRDEVQLPVPPGMPDEERLRRINPDYLFWLFIPGTGVDYPVVRSRDNEEYLKISFTGKESAAGTLFLDVFSSGDNLIIHGHNRKSGAMFGTLSRFLEDKYRESHREIWICQDRRWEKYCITGVKQYRHGEEKPYRAKPGEKTLILSTCAGENRLLVKAEKEECGR